MWSGLIIAVLWQMQDILLGLHPIFIGLPVSVIILLAVTFITNGKETVKA